MQRRGRILAIDDQPEWHLVVRSSLGGQSYLIDAADNLATAKEMLSHNFYHLVVLDIRMNDSDPSDVEGMNFLEDLNTFGLGNGMEVVMLSAYGDKKQMRTAFSEYKVADFFPKDEFYPEEFLNKVQEIFSAKVRINLDLNIHWQQVSGAEEALVNLLIDKTRIKAGTPLQGQIAAELDDLLCRLFFEATEVIVTPMNSGNSGAGVLSVQAFYPSGGAQPKVVKFGAFHEIEQEYENFKHFVRPYLGGGRSAAIDDLRRTSKLGGIIYSHLGAASDHLEPFSNYYSRSEVPQIKTTLDDLFHRTCGAWYSNPGVLHPFDLSAHYEERMGFTAAKLDQALTDNLKSVVLKMTHGRRVLHFNTLAGDHDFVDPISMIGEARFVRSTYKCITHGDLNAANILVDVTGQTWLIDFQGTGPGHILRDVAELESIVRFQLLKAGDATMEERLKMELKLSSISGFADLEKMSGEFVTGNEPLDKAYAVAIHIRRIARQLISQHRDDDISEYYVALLYYSLNMIRFYALPSLQRQHALLCASLLAENLKT